MATDKKVKVCFLDLYNIRSEEQFYNYMATEVLKSLAGKLQEIGDYAKKFLGRFVPQLTMSLEPNSEVSLGMNWAEVKKSPDEILDLAEKMAIDKGIRLIICIDEFQDVGSFSNPLDFQKKLRSRWQHHQHVTYCLYGSKRHMMMDVFASSSMPFYKFGEIVFLPKIKSEDWVKFITSRFKATGKKIKPRDAALIADKVECHPYYVQQLAHQAWLRTTTECSAEIVESAFMGMTDQLSMLFQTGINNLSTTQANFLHALINGEEQLSSKKTIKKYRLGTSANVARIKQALLNKDAIDILPDRIDFIDPVFKDWLKNHYFKNIPG